MVSMAASFQLAALLCILWISRSAGFVRPRIGHSFVSSHLRRCVSSGAIPPIVSNVQQEGVELATDLSDELKKSFMSYSMSTILGRALPDVRDGLKPVHRRVLYAMHLLGLSPNASYRKCARIVGEVLGKFHPHGDQSVYDALVRMAQDFVALHPLIDGHGNFGSVDNDPPAAMRYTEARLSTLAHEVLLSELKDETVRLAGNFDGSEQEPVILPAQLPLLLINGASGIAVGMATNVPPHNLGEVVDAMVALIDSPDLAEEELRRLVPGPDFPTGGQLLGTAGVQQLYTEGRGSISLRATTHIETIASSSEGKGGRGGGGSSSSSPASTSSRSRGSRQAIIVTELPYMTNKAALLEKMADLVNAKKLDGIADLRDESDRNGIRVVIELKRDAQPAKVLERLFRKTSLQSVVAGNLLALVESGQRPSRLTLRELLHHFIAFRTETVRRRAENQVNKLKQRAHLVQGLLSALRYVQDVVQIVQKSKDASTAKAVLLDAPYFFSSEQAEAILGLTLRRLTSLEGQRLQDEHSDLDRRIAELDRLLADEQHIRNKIKEESLQLKKEFAVPRRTVIIAE